MISSQKLNTKAVAADVTSTSSKHLNVDEFAPFVFNAYQSLAITEQREKLPIRKYRDQILYCLEQHQVVILVGETGSGKSTQVPQYLYEWGWHTKGLIGITEPLRVSAITLADRVAVERGERLGKTVGVVARFVDQLSEQTHIKYMTEGILMRELLANPLLTQYSVIMLDEAHERSLLTDTLLGLLKKILKKRSALKLIISSATIDPTLFLEFFEWKRYNADGSLITKPNSIALTVEGRMHPVKIFYASAPCADYVQAAVETVWKIHQKEPMGDVLVFLTGQEEVLDAIERFKQYLTDETEQERVQVLPMYGALNRHDQLKVFFYAPKGVRKVIFATNIAETSITIPGIAYVVDCGFVKLKWFDADHALDRLVVVPISKAGAAQRAGRAGRMRPGKVYRLYTEANYGELPDRIPPEMRRTDLSSVVLQLKALGIDNILRFDFLAAPPAKNMLAAIQALHAQGALDKIGALTQPLGFLIAEMPFDHMHSKMLYASGQLGCSEEIITILAMLQAQPIFSKAESAQAQVARRNFEVQEGDLITLLNVYEAFVANDSSREFCGQYFLIYRSLKRACELRTQLCNMCSRKFGIPLFSCKGDVEIICRAITAGFFMNAAYLHHSGHYRKVNGDMQLTIHPQSALYSVTQPQYIVFSELLQTTNTFMSNITVTKEEWLLACAPHYYSKKTVRSE